MGVELSEKAKQLLARRGFDPVLGARPLRRTIQREIEDVMSEKILFGELGAGEIVFVDVEGWDGESKDTDAAQFTFTPHPKPLPEEQFGDMAVETAEALKEVESAADGDVPESGSVSDEELDKLREDGEHLPEQPGQPGGNPGAAGDSSFGEGSASQN